MAPSASDRQAMMAGLRDADASSGNAEDQRAERLRKAQETRVLRGEMREQMDEAGGLRKDVQNTTAAQIEEFVHRGDARFARVNRPQEAALDSKAFMTTAQTAALKARQLKVDQNAFDTNEFLLRLKKTLGHKRPRNAAAEGSDSDSDDDEADMLGDWTSIGWMGVKYTKRVVLPNFVLGPLSVTPKTRTTHKRARLEISKAKHAEPEAISKESTKKDANESSTLTHRVEAWLSDAYSHKFSRGEPLNFFEFVIDPLSFDQTVENIFYLSFSIAKGVAALEVNEDTGMLELISSEPADAQAAEEGAAKLQMVMEMDMATWQDAIELFKIKKNEWIPHRPPIETEAGKYYR